MPITHSASEVLMLTKEQLHVSLITCSMYVHVVKTIPGYKQIYT